MYTKYFGFNEKPFTLTPNPRFIFLSKNHKEAFAHLLYGINNHYGFIELIGEVGTGKTTVLRTLLGQLHDDNYRTALIFNPCLSGIELLRSINQEFGIKSDCEYANELLAEMNRFLLTENAKGHTVVLVIDEAQNLKPEVLEQLRLISNLETENDKLIQIILAGQPELAALLERPELRQLNQRIAVRYKLKSMNMNETRAYIRHRMEVAGETGGVSFSFYAIKWIYLYTIGVPRMINILCDRALLIAYGDERRRISSGIVTRAIREIIKRPAERRLSVAIAGLITLVLVVVFATAVVRWLSADHRSQPPQAPAVNAAVQSPPSAESEKQASSAKLQTELVEPVARLKQDILSLDQNSAHTSAFNAIVDGWGAKPVQALNGDLRVPDIFTSMVNRRNLRVATMHGTLNDALRLELPFLLVSKVSGKLGDYCLAVTAYGDNDTLSVSPPLSGRPTVKKDTLAAIANGTFYFVWSNTGNIPDNIKLGEKRSEIKPLQRQLKQAGFYHDAIDGFYSHASAKAVREFQRSLGITANDAVGALTLAALARYDTTQPVPSLKGIIKAR
jgi:general secretion pathway protein A